MATERYAAEVKADFAAMEREAKAACPRAWALMLELDEMLRRPLDGPATRQVERYERHMLYMIDRRCDISAMTERFVRGAIASLKGDIA